MKEKVYIPTTGKKQEIVSLPPDISEYRYITIRRLRNEPVTADEAKHILRAVGVSETNIKALAWENYRKAGEL